MQHKADFKLIQTRKVLSCCPGHNISTLYQTYQHATANIGRAYMTFSLCHKGNCKNRNSLNATFARPAPPFSLPPLLCMQPIGICIRILTMQKSSEEAAEDEQNIKHEGRQTLLAITWLRSLGWPLQASGGYANGGRCVPSSSPSAASAAATPQYAWRRTDWKRIKVANQCAL